MLRLSLLASLLPAAQCWSLSLPRGGGSRIHVRHLTGRGPSSGLSDELIVQVHGLPRELKWSGIVATMQPMLPESCELLDAVMSLKRARRRSGAPAPAPWRQRWRRGWRRPSARVGGIQMLTRDAIEPSGKIRVMPIIADGVNIDQVMDFMAEYLPKVNPLVATGGAAELRAKVTAQAYKDNIMADGLSSVLYVDGVLRAAAFGRKIQIGEDDQDVYVGEGELGNKMAKLQMFAEWREEGLRADECATFGYLAVDSRHFRTPRDAGAIAAKLLDYNVELARQNGIKRIRSPSQGQFKDAILSQHRDFAVWRAADDFAVSSGGDYPNDWKARTLLQDPGNQWVFTGSL